MAKVDTISHWFYVSTFYNEKGTYRVKQSVPGSSAINLFAKAIEEHLLDTNADKTTVLSCHRCLINPGVEK